MRVGKWPVSPVQPAPDAALVRPSLWEADGRRCCLRRSVKVTTVLAEFDSLVQTAKEVYQIQAVSSEYTRFAGIKGDLGIEIRCTYSEGSPYIDLVLFAYSKALSEQFRSALHKN